MTNLQNIAENLAQVHTNTVVYGDLLLSKYLPAIHSHLIAGMVLGSEMIKDDKRFYSALVDTSLVHVVVVSGYNINLVLTWTEKLLKLRYDKRGITVLFILLVSYMLLCGLTAPVVRSGIMGFLAYWSRFSGRSTGVFYIFLLTIIIMLCVNLSYLTSVSFWLSVSATAGLIFLANDIHIYLISKLTAFNLIVKFPILKYLAGEFATTLAANFAVMPIISFCFGRLNILSPIFNVGALWLVPIITILGFLQLFFSFIWEGFGHIFSYVIYVPTTLFILLVNFFERFEFANVNFKLSILGFCFYYGILFMFIVHSKFRKKDVTS